MLWLKVKGREGKGRGGKGDGGKGRQATGLRNERGRERN